MWFRLLYISCASFLVAFTVYWTMNDEPYAGTDVADGKLVWQKYNCQACHQFYGLGGYLGPDLTNVFSKPGKTETYIKAVIKSGNAVMPGFDLSETEMKHLLQFFKSMNETGNADATELHTAASGMIE